MWGLRLGPGRRLPHTQTSFKIHLKRCMFDEDVSISNASWGQMLDESRVHCTFNWFLSLRKSTLFCLNYGGISKRRKMFPCTRIGKLRNTSITWTSTRWRRLMSPYVVVDRDAYPVRGRMTPRYNKPSLVVGSAAKPSTECPPSSSWQPTPSTSFCPWRLLWEVLHPPVLLHHHHQHLDGVLLLLSQYILFSPPSCSILFRL